MSETRYVYRVSWNSDGTLDIDKHEITKETPKTIYYKFMDYRRPSQIRKEELDMVRWSEVISYSPEAARKAWLEFAKRQVEEQNRQLEKWCKRIDTLKEG